MSKGVKGFVVVLEDDISEGTAEPLHKKDGRTFDIAEWREWTKIQLAMSPHEMLTGEKPPEVRRG